ncbi:MAG: ACT domain-containing protein [Planctomycetota bacterium]
MKLKWLSGKYSVCRLPPCSAVPGWAADAFSITRTGEELSIIASQDVVPDGVQAQHGFGCFRVNQPLKFDEVGIIASISQILATERIAILSISTYDTDYFLVSNDSQKQAQSALQIQGYEFIA